MYGTIFLDGFVPFEILSITARLLITVRKIINLGSGKCNNHKVIECGVYIIKCNNHKIIECGIYIIKS